MLIRWRSFPPPPLLSRPVFVATWRRSLHAWSLSSSLCEPASSSQMLSQQWGPKASLSLSLLLCGMCEQTSLCPLLTVFLRCLSAVTDSLSSVRGWCFMSGEPAAEHKHTHWPQSESAAYAGLLLCVITIQLQVCVFTAEAYMHDYIVNTEVKSGSCEDANTLESTHRC